MSLTHRFLKNVRALHLYLGVFTAPALFFFAFTGGLQSFGLHESSRGSSYQPPAWLASMAQMHKKQTFEVHHRPRRVESVGPAIGPNASMAVPVGSGSTAHASKSEHAPEGRQKNLLPMKIFFALVALSLFVSTLTGLYMAWRFSRRPRLISGVLLAGILVPVVLAML